MIYCSAVETETFRVILKLPIKIAVRVLSACASKCLLHQLHLQLGRVTSHGLPPLSGDFSFHECITLFLIQQLNSQSFPSQHRPMNLHCEIQRNPKTGEEDRCIYHAQMM